MKSRYNRIFQVVGIVIVLCAEYAQAQNSTNSSPNFSETVKSANSLFAAKQPDAALEMANKAIQLDGSRYEGYALAALILEKQGNLEEASQKAAKALELAPAEKKTALSQFRDSIENQKSKTIPIIASPGEIRRKYAALMQIVEDADKAKSPQERTKYLNEFLEKSDDFANTHLAQTNIWVMRAAAAVELNRSVAAEQAARQLKALGMMESQEPKLRALIEQLERKGWTGNPLKMLTLIMGDAEKAPNPAARVQGLQEFLVKSRDFAGSHPQEGSIWIMRAQAAAELDYSFLGWQAGQRLKALGLLESSEPTVAQIAATLERKGWLSDKRSKTDWIGRSTEKIKAAADIGDEDAAERLKQVALTLKEELVKLSKEFGNYENITQDSKLKDSYHYTNSHNTQLEFENDRLKLIVSEEATSTDTSIYRFSQNLDCLLTNINHLRN